MRLIDILSEIKKNTSTDSKVLYKYIVDTFGNDVKVERPSDPFLETIEIRFKEDLPNNLRKYIKSNNWYIAKSKSNIIQINPTYSKGTIPKEKLPKQLYHATPTSNIDNIMKYGIESRSMDLRHKYPNRIYLSGRLPMIKLLAKELKHYKKGVDFSILEIDIKAVVGELYNDLTSAQFGSYYVQNTKILPKYIKVIQNNI